MIKAPKVDALHHPRVTVSAKNRRRFEAWANALARDIAPLRKLATTLPVWQA